MSDATSVKAGRRAFLSIGMATAAAAVSPPAMAAVLGAQTAPPPRAPTLATSDPAVALWTRICALETELRPINDRHSQLRTFMVAEAGDEPWMPSYQERWGGSPEEAELKALIERSDALGDRIADLHDALGEAVPTTPEGVQAKASAALGIILGERWLSERWFAYDLVVSALRAAAGRA